MDDVEERIRRAVIAAASEAEREAILRDILSSALRSTRPLIERLLDGLGQSDSLSPGFRDDVAAALIAAAREGVAAAVERTPGFRRGDFIGTELEDFLSDLDVDGLENG